MININPKYGPFKDLRAFSIRDQAIFYQLPRNKTTNSWTPPQKKKKKKIGIKFKEILSTVEFYIKNTESTKVCKLDFLVNICSSSNLKTLQPKHYC